MNLNQIIKVIFAGIFTFLVIGSLSSISNSIFLEKVIDNLSTLSTAKLNKLREEFFNIQSLLDENKKILTHTVVGREELLELINEQEVKLNELSYLTSADAASEHLQKLNNDLKLTKEALSHSVMGREELKRKIEQTKSEISSFIKIMPSSENLSMAKINEEETKPSVEKDVVVEKPKHTFEEELALASVEAELNLSKISTCRSADSTNASALGSPYFFCKSCKTRCCTP